MPVVVSSFGLLLYCDFGNYKVLKVLGGISKKLVSLVHWPSEFAQLISIAGLGYGVVSAH